MISWDILKASLDRIQKATDKKRVCVGFDGYVDTLYRVVRSRKSLQCFELFSTIGEFADRVGKAAGRSADMELQGVSRRMGGNAPLMAEAMGCLNVSARCIGTMGYPETEDVFAADKVHFIPNSVAPCAGSMAFEFSDGKLMFGDTAPLLTLDWDRITTVLGLENLKAWYQGCNAWAVVNWSFVLNCNDILEGFLRDVVDGCDGGKILFFDLADPSGRSREELLRLFDLLGRLNRKNRVVLSMNENESLHVASALDLSGETLLAEHRAEAIREKLRIYMASVHALDYAVAATAEQMVRADTVFHADPVISTGGGDHFNGGFCTALIHGLTPGDALAFGNLVSSCYVGGGHSPSLSQLADYITKCSK